MTRISILIWLLIAACLPALAQPSSVKIRDLRYEYLATPSGQDEPSPRLSWSLEATSVKQFGQKQIAYRLLVATSAQTLQSGKGDAWDSGWIRSDEMSVVYKGRKLNSDRSYFWKVAVKDEAGRISAWSKIAQWSTGIFDPKEWQAQWIGSDQQFDPSKRDCNIIDPWLRKMFDLAAKPKKATLFVASVGFHEVYVNGKRISDHVMAPAVSDHSKRARYVAYNIDTALVKGKNVIALWLGTGWSIHGPYVVEGRPNTPIVSAQVSLYDQKYPSSSARPVLTIKTDDSWKTHPSPNRLLGVWDSNFMGGELWDARNEDPNWNTVNGSEKDWKQVSVYKPNLKLSAQQVEPNKLFREITPVAVQARPDGSYRVDMGVNFAGWTEVKLKGSPGDTIRFQYSEREQNDMTFRLNSAYVIGSKGEGTFRNRFNYSSGRWVTIRGLKYKPQLSDIKGWQVRTAYDQATSFVCSDTLQNWIYNTVRWTYENLSLGGMVVDCPQRERLGYGGDAHATVETGLYNYKMGAFYTKWMEDWRDVQGTESIVGNMYDASFAHKNLQGGRPLHPGILPHTAPTYMGGGGPPWGGIVVTLPWFVYQHQGDRRILEQNYGLIKGWLEFLDTQTKDDMLTRFGGPWDFLGDWLWPNATAEGMDNNKPQALCFNNSYRVFNLRTAAKIARTLNRTTDAERWEHQADASAKAIHAQYYIAADHNYADGSMSNLTAALLAGVPSASERKAIFDKLENDILVKRNGHIHVGITGGALLFKLLRDEGREDLIYSMTSQTTYPGWGYMKANNATTIWEMWEKDLPGHSLLHSSYLYPGAWYIDGVAGIKRDPDHPGFRHFIISPPHLTERQMQWAEASFDSPSGMIKTRWERKDGRLAMQVTVPPNCTATLQLSPNDGSVHINGKPVRTNTKGSYQLSAGSYQINAVRT